ncbi:MAG: hypothetical protein EOO17_06380 [Chloroflexi bacterium]|nr:MAG: hypothetical protein EOO17_06380 [Chloroflexota bacterium]
MKARSFLSQIATILSLMTAVGFGLGTGTASAVPQQSIEQSYVARSIRTTGSTSGRAPTDCRLARTAPAAHRPCTSPTPM